MLDKLFLGVLLILLAGKWSHGKGKSYVIPARFRNSSKLIVLSNIRVNEENFDYQLVVISLKNRR